MVAHTATLSSAPAIQRGRSMADRALTVVLALLGSVLIVAIAFLLFGGRAFIVRSGSMAPAIDVGDMVVTRTVVPTDVEVGDVITFSDPTRSGDLVTHRVRRMKAEGSRVAFVTKGDANGGVERWTIARDGRLGRVMWNAPKLGYAASWAAEPTARFALLLMGSVLFAGSVLRRIWSE